LDGRGRALPWVSRDEHLWESEHIHSISTGFLDVADCLLDTALEIKPDRLSLDGSDFDGGHFDAGFCKLHNWRIEELENWERGRMMKCEVASGERRAAHSRILIYCYTLLVKASSLARLST